MRRNNIPVSQDTLEQKVRKHYQQCVKVGVDLPAKIEAANGWLSRFQKLCKETISGESLSVNWSIVEQYSRKNIYNADETGLFLIVTLYLLYT